MDKNTTAIANRFVLANGLLTYVIAKLDRLM